MQIGGDKDMDFGGILVSLMLSVIIAIATCMPAAFLFLLVERLIEQPTSDVWATSDNEEMPDEM